MTKPLLRCSAYLAVLLALSSALNFHRLNERAFDADEAIYAYVTKNMERSGDWLHRQFRSPNGPDPCHYRNKPPLYFWLACAARYVFADEHFALRFWSALFGVGCVLLTCILGAMLFSPEIGFLAALLLALNRDFILLHGARDGTMDTGVTLFTLAAALLAWLSLRMRRPWLGWLAAGGAAGIICLFKEIPPGVLVLFLISIHAVIYSERGTRLSRLRRPPVALAGLAAVSLPWFIFHWASYGGFSELRHARRFAGTLHAGHLEGPLFYMERITTSSDPFHLFIPVMAIVVVLSFFGGKRKEFGLIAVVGGGWIGAITAMASKLPWYPYPAYPMVALAIAAVVIGPLQFLISRYVPEKARLCAMSALAAAALLAAVPYGKAFKDELIPRQLRTIRDLRWELYKNNDLEHRDVRIVHVEYPGEVLDRFRDYYADHMMKGYARATELEQLDAFLVKENPVMVSIRTGAPAPLAEAVEMRLRQYAAGKGGRYTSPLYTVYTRGIEPPLPEGVLAKMHALNAYYPMMNEKIHMYTPASEALLGRGWRDTDSNARWSIGDTASLRFLLRKTVPLNLEMEVRTFRRQRIIVELNGVTLDTVQAEGKWKEHTFLLPKEHLRPDNELIFRLPDAKSPKDIGAGQDAAVLGMYVPWIRFIERDGAGPLPGESREASGGQ